MPPLYEGQCSVIAAIFSAVVGLLIASLLAQGTIADDFLDKLLVNIKVLCEIVNAKRCLQRAHATENFLRTHVYRTCWGKEPKCLHEVDVRPSAGGHCYGNRVQSELLDDGPIRSAQAFFIGEGLTRMQTLFVAQGASDVFTPVATALGQLRCLVESWQAPQ